MLLARIGDPCLPPDHHVAPFAREIDVRWLVRPTSRALGRLIVGAQEDGSRSLA